MSIKDAVVSNMDKVMPVVTLANANSTYLPPVGSLRKDFSPDGNPFQKGPPWDKSFEKSFSKAK